MKAYRVLPGESFGVSDQFKAWDILTPGYLTDEEALIYLGWKLEVVRPVAELANSVSGLFVADAPVKPTKSK